MILVIYETNNTQKSDCYEDTPEVHTRLNALIKAFIRAGETVYICSKWIKLRTDNFLLKVSLGGVIISTTTALKKRMFYWYEFRKEITHPFELDLLKQTRNVARSTELDPFFAEYSLDNVLIGYFKFTTGF